MTSRICNRVFPTVLLIAIAGCSDPRNKKNSSDFAVEELIGIFKKIDVEEVIRRRNGHNFFSSGDVELTPASGAKNVGLSTQLQLTFPQPMTRGNGEIRIYKGPDLLQMIKIVKTKPTPLDPATFKKRMTITGVRLLEPNSDYHVLVSPSAFKNEKGEYFEGISSESAWTFQTQDGKAPTVTAFFPADDAVDVSGSTAFGITFSEPILAGAGKVELYKGTTLIEHFEAAATEINSTTVSFQPTEPLEAGAYHIKIDTTAFKDHTESRYVGINTSHAWNFAVGKPSQLALVDSDGDGIPDTLDKCQGVDDTLLEILYADLDLDGLVVPSAEPRCPDAIYRFHASELSTYQLANFDVDDATPVTAWNAATITEAGAGVDLNGDGDVIDLDIYNVILNPSQWIDFANACGAGQNASCFSNVWVVNDLDFAVLDGTANDTIASDGAYTTGSIIDMVGHSTNTDYYTGVINGGNRTFSNLNFDMPLVNFVGLVGLANFTGIGVTRIVDLTYKGNITGGRFVGLIGLLVEEVHFMNVHVDGIIQGVTWTGGLAGGSLVGTTFISKSSVRGSVSASTLSVDGAVAGLFAGGGAATITDSYNLADVTGGGVVQAAGLVAYHDGDSSFTRSFNHGNIISDIEAAGIAILEQDDTVSFTDVYNAGTVTSTGSYDAAGIVSASLVSTPMDRDFMNVYNIGSLSSADDSRACSIEDFAVQNPGGGDVFNVYYLDSTANPSCTSIGVPHNAISMKQEASFAGFDFINVWAIDENTSYPYLRDVTPANQKPQ